MRIDRFASLLACCFLLSAGTVQGQTEPTRPDYRNPALPTAQRVEDLLQRLTLEEKVAQMMCLWSAKSQITDAQGRFDPARAPRWFRVGIGRIERPSDNHGARAEAEFTNAIQRWVRENTRLGIPVIFHEEALHGLQGPEATSFPQAIALASTWNPDLVRRVFTVVSARGPRPRGPAGARARGRRGPRPALGADRGDVRRGPVPGGADGAGGGPRPPGRRPDGRGRPCDRHAQAHDRARPAGIRRRTSARPRSASGRSATSFSRPSSWPSNRGTPRA